MVMLQSHVFLVVVMLTMFPRGFGAALHVEVVDDKNSGSIHKQVNISCVHDGQSVSSNQIIVMEIAKKGQNPIAWMRQHSAISFGNGMKSHFKAGGHLKQDGAPNYLQLTITNPEWKDLGVYTCVMYSSTDLGTMREDKANANLTLDHLDITDIVEYLMNKISNLESKVSVQSDKINDQDKKLADQNTLRNQIKNEFTQLKNQLINHILDNTTELNNSLNDTNSKLQIIKLKEQNNNLQKQLYDADIKFQSQMNDVYVELHKEMNDTRVNVEKRLQDANEVLLKQVNDTDIRLREQMKHAHTELQTQMNDSHNELQKQINYNIDISTHQQMNDTDLQKRFSKLQTEINDKYNTVHKQINYVDFELQIQMNKTHNNLQKQMNEADISFKKQINETHRVLKEQMNDTKARLEKQINDADNQLEKEIDNADIAFQTRMNETYHNLHNQMNDALIALKTWVNNNLQKQMNETDSQLEKQINNTHFAFQTKMNEELFKLQKQTNHADSQLEKQMHDANIELQARMNETYYRLQKDTNDIIDSHLSKQRNDTNSNFQKQLRDQGEKWSSALDDLEHELERIFTYMNDQINQQNSKGVSAFAASFDKKDKIGNKKVLVFSDVFTNIGNNYDNATGVYTAPVDGIYVFHLFLETKGADHQIQVNILANNRAVAKLYAADDKHGDQSSVSTVVQLQFQDIVQLFVYATNTNYVFTDSLSVFSGFLLKKI